MCCNEYLFGGFGSACLMIFKKVLFVHGTLLGCVNMESCITE